MFILRGNTRIAITQKNSACPSAYQHNFPLLASMKNRNVYYTVTVHVSISFKPDT